MQPLHADRVTPRAALPWRPQTAHRSNPARGQAELPQRHMASPTSAALAIAAALAVASFSARAASIAARELDLEGMCLSAAVAAVLEAALGWVTGAGADDPPSSLKFNAIVITGGGTDMGLGAAHRSGLDAISNGTVLSSLDKSCRITTHTLGNVRTETQFHQTTFSTRAHATSDLEHDIPHFWRVALGVWAQVLDAHWAWMQQNQSAVFSGF
jgi:hypothetical protein